jgi:signal transduction histidine kinase/DNA-binding NarL/FixJ family response regulator
MSLPLSREVTDAMAQRTLPPVAQPPKILYIEDSLTTRMRVRAVLEAEGYVVVDAADGLAGIEAAVREEPSLILLDINLPGADGYEVVALLKSFPTLAAIPVVALTGCATDGDRERTLVAGCDGFIAKPIDVEAFPRQVHEFLAGKRERVAETEAGAYLRDLNQRFVYRLLSQVEELRRFNGHFARRAAQLEDLHAAVQSITSDLGVATLLEKLLPALRRALGATSLTVELSATPPLTVAAHAEPRERAVPGRAGPPAATEDSQEVEWRLPLEVAGRGLGTMTARQAVPSPATTTEAEGLFRLVANQVAIAVENARLYEGVMRRASEHQSLVEAGRLLASTLEVGEVLRRLAELTRTRLDVDVVRIWLRDDDTALGPVEEIARWIMAHRTPLVLPDLRADPRIRDGGWVTAEGLLSFLGVPLLLEDTPVGVLLALSRRPRAFSADEVALAEALATSAAAAIRNARLHEETQERLRHTETLVEISRTLGAMLDPAEVAEIAMARLARALGADLALAWRFQADPERPLAVTGHQLPAGLLEMFAEAPADVTAQLAEEARRLTRTVHASDSQADPRFRHPFLRDLSHRSLLLSPFAVNGEALGGVALAWTWEAHRFTADELRLVDGIAAQAAMAIENSRLYRELREALSTVETSQKRIVQGERLRALGEMAGGVAHDFNNFLAIILGRAELLLTTATTLEVRKQLETVIKVGNDAARTVKRIQEFTRMRKARPFQPVNLTHLVGEVVDITRSRWKDEADARGIRYDVVTEGASVPPVAGDPSELREALTNIIFNALDVMPEGGRLVVRTGVEGNRVFCSIRDTGVGMTEEVKQRIFEPFFTTKGERGTGLGLSVVYGIVNRHGGELDVQSRVGEGSEFTIRLPLGGELDEPMAGTLPAAPPRRARILVIDDEPFVCAVLTDLLSADGHTVVTCPDGESGLTRLETEAFELVITDFGMPRMSGWEVARFAKLLRPETPVIMVTGWSDQIDRSDLAPRGVDYLVAKPFKLDDVRAVVAAALTGDRTLA